MRNLILLVVLLVGSLAFGQGGQSVKGATQPGNNNFTGNNTFTKPPKVPTPVENTDAANKAYVDQVVTQFAFPPLNGALQVGAPLFQMPVAYPFTLPADGRYGNCVSHLLVGTLPTADWTVTIVRYPASTAGCFTSTPSPVGTVTVSPTGAEQWQTVQTTFNTGDCYQVNAPQTPDQTAASPQLAQCVLKQK